MKTLIRLGGWPGWSASSLGAHVILLVLACGASYVNAVWLYFCIVSKLVRIISSALVFRCIKAVYVYVHFKYTDQTNNVPRLKSVVEFEKFFYTSFDTLFSNKQHMSDWHNYFLICYDVGMNVPLNQKSHSHFISPGAVVRSEASSLGMQAAPSSIPASGTFFFYI